MWRVPWGAWFQSLKTRSPQGNLDMNLFKIKLPTGANKINSEIRWPKEPLGTFICLKVGLNKVIPPKSNKFGILFCSCPSLGIWLTVGVMTYSARRSLWTQTCPPSKQRTSNQRSAQALHSIRFVFWPVLHILKQFCVMHDACFLQISSICYSRSCFSVSSKLNLYHLYHHLLCPCWAILALLWARQLKARNVFIWHLVPQMNTLILGPLEACWVYFLLSVVEINSRQGVCWANVRPTWS